jgi:hypothetical protein
MSAINGCRGELHGPINGERCAIVSSMVLLLLLLWSSLSLADPHGPRH